MQCCTASIDRSSQRHRVTGHWRRPSLCLFPSLPLSHSVSLSPSLTFSQSPPHPFTVPFCDRLLALSFSFYPSVSLSFVLSLSFRLPARDLSLSAYLVLNYPNSISVQLQFIPVSKRQSRRVHFASASRRQKQSFLSSARTCRIYSPVTPQPFVFFFVFVWSVR